jgi:hypothetical protein
LLAESTWSFEEKQKENPEMPQATTYDAIVIGTSQGGRFLPIALAEGLNALFLMLDS